MHVLKGLRKPAGFILETSTETGKVREIQTFMCVHCNRHVILWAHGDRPSDVGGYCSDCHGPICDRCVKSGVCDPLMKKLDRWAEQHFRQTQLIKEL